MTSINNQVKEPVQSLSAPVSRVLRTKGGRPRRASQARGSENQVDARPASVPHEAENAVVRGDDREGSAKAQRPRRAGQKKRPTRANANERVVKSAESSLSVVEDSKENDASSASLGATAEGRARKADALSLGLYFQLPSQRGFGVPSTSSSAAPREPFIGAKTFTGPRDGYVYKHGSFGVGYYLDRLPKIQGQMCAQAMVDVILDQCAASVERLSIIKARRVVNALVDSAVEISHHQLEVHWYENGGEERAETVAENLDFAARHDHTRWESWEVVVAKILRLDASDSREIRDYLTSQALKSSLARAHAKRPDHIGAVLELVSDRSRSEGEGRADLSMERTAQVLSKHKISPRALRGLQTALRKCVAGQRGRESRETGSQVAVMAPSVCQQCTSLRGRRLCTLCSRMKKAGIGGKTLGGSLPACVRQNSYGSLLYRDWTWSESKGQLAKVSARLDQDESQLHDSLLDMVYRLQVKALKRVFTAWKVSIFQTKATRAKDRLSEARIVARTFRRWKLAVNFKGEGGREAKASSSDEKAQASSSSSYVADFAASSSMASIGEKIKRVT